MGTKVLTEKQPLDLQGLLGILDCLAQLSERNAVLRSQRPQYVCFDQIPERKDRRLTRWRMNKRLKTPYSFGRRVGPPDHPRPERHRWPAEISRALRQCVGWLVPEIRILAVSPAFCIP